MKKIPQKFRAPIRAMDRIFDNLTEGLQSHQEDEERFDAGEFCVQYQDGPWEAAEYTASLIAATAFGVNRKELADFWVEANYQEESIASEKWWASQNRTCCLRAAENGVDCPNHTNIEITTLGEI